VIEFARTLGVDRAPLYRWVHEIKHDGYKFTATATRSGCSPVGLRR
jgi:hypothetical protein